MMKPGDKIRVPLRQSYRAGKAPHFADEGQERERLIAQLMPAPPAHAPAGVQAAYFEVVGELHNFPLDYLRALCAHQESDAHRAWVAIIFRAIAHLAPEHQSTFLTPPRPPPEA